MKRLRGMQFVLIQVSLMGLNLTTWAHTNISPQDAKNMIGANNQLIVIDVREESEYCVGNVEGCPSTSGWLCFNLDGPV